MTCVWYLAMCSVAIWLCASLTSMQAAVVVMAVMVTRSSSPPSSRHLLGLLNQQQTHTYSVLFLHVSSHAQTLAKEVGVAESSPAHPRGRI